MFVDKTVKEFLGELSSNSPVPGGGSVAALSAAVSASLAAMVANLTIGKKNYEGVQEEVKAVAEKAEQLIAKFSKDIDRDSDAFNEVMGAFKLPKETEEEKEKRKNAIQEYTKNAALVPLEVARDAYNMLKIIEVVVEKGNKNAVTDGAVAAMMARTAVLSALYNVKINLGSIKDEEFVTRLTQEVESLEKNVKAEEERILSKVVL